MVTILRTKLTPVFLVQSNQAVLITGLAAYRGRHSSCIGNTHTHVELCVYSRYVAAYAFP